MSEHFVSRLELMLETGCKLIRISNGFLNFADCISWMFLAYISKFIYWF